MSYYVILCLIILFLYPLMGNKTINNDMLMINNNNKLYIVIISIFMIVMLGLRNIEVGIDTKNYFYSFDYMLHLSLEEVLQTKQEIGFALLQFIINRLTDNFYFLNTIVATVYIGAVSCHIRKYSKNPMLSYLFFIFFGFFTFAMSATRQTLAIAMTLIAFDFIVQKKFCWFILFLMLAVSFHITAIVFLPSYWFNKLKLNYRSLLLFIIIGIVVIIIKDNLRLLLNTYARLSYLSVETGGQMMYIFFLISLILGIFYKESMIKNSENNKYLLYMIITTAIIFPLTQFNPAIMRLYFYYSIFLITYLPNLLCSIKDRAIRSLGIISYLIVGAIWFFNSILYTNELVEYLFFWQELYY